MKRRSFFSLLEHMMDRLAAVLGAFLFSQFPMFLQQYLQRLAGHRDELKHTLKMIEQASLSSGKTVQEYIAKFLVNPDPDILQQGQWLEQLFARSRHLDSAYGAIEHAPFYLKPWEFLIHFQPEIAKSTFHSFQPGFTTTWEGISYALIGCLFGIFAYRFLMSCFGMVRSVLFPLQKEPQEEPNEPPSTV